MSNQVHNIQTLTAKIDGSTREAEQQRAVARLCMRVHLYDNILGVRCRYECLAVASRLVHLTYDCKHIDTKTGGSSNKVHENYEG